MLNIKDRFNADITIPENESAGQSLTLINLQNCKLSIGGYLGALYIYDCSGCVFDVGFVKTACNMYNCEASQIKTVW